jgi:murein DD-endopeptidase MepM/ murein hydrolase activator NlpD
MIYPTNHFKEDWYSAQKFGNPTNYGFHEGEDLNLKTGGDTDLGQEIKAIANGRVIYYHYSSHPTTNFGRHLVYKIDGGWGTRWVHCAHLLDQDFTKEVKDVSEGQIIARLGKSGTPYAHLHFAIYKVDPVSVGGIDNIANTQEELNRVWEDPIAFIEKWMQPVVQPQPVTDQSKYNFGDPWGEIELQKARSILVEQKSTIEDLSGKIENIKQIVG